MEVNMIQHEEYLEFIVTGKYDHNKALNQLTFGSVIDTCRLKGKDKALIDVSKLEGNIAATIKSLYVMKIADLYDNHLRSGGNPLKIAYFVSPNMVSSIEFGSEIARKEGLPTTLKTNKKDALCWLGVNS